MIIRGDGPGTNLLHKLSLTWLHKHIRTFHLAIICGICYMDTLWVLLLLL